VIRLNWQLAFAPRGVLEYVVDHELCHLRERSHGVGYWRLVRGCSWIIRGRKGFAVHLIMHGSPATFRMDAPFARMHEESSYSLPLGGR
jgi:hypothetical protein